jgi:hypothetical protein
MKRKFIKWQKGNHGLEFNASEKWINSTTSHVFSFSRMVSNLSVLFILECEEYCLLGYNAMKSIKSQLMFQKNILPPFSGSKNKPSKISACLLPTFMLVSCLAYFSTLKMKAMCSSERLVDFQWTTWRYIPEDSTPHNHCCENLISYIIECVW